MKPVVSVVAALIYNDKNELFIAQRNEHMTFPLMWEFPGGKVEEGEAHHVALARELQEELAIDTVVNKERVAKTQYELPKVMLELHFYIVQIFSGEPTLHEHTDAKWVAVSDLDESMFAPADQEVVRQLKREVK